MSSTRTNTAASSSADKTAAKPNGAPRGRSASPIKPGSREANRLAVAILEVLAGVRTPADAAAVLGTSVPRYYLLEQRALEAIVAACEPRPLGPGHVLERQIRHLQREVASLKQECSRQQALARAAQRTVGLNAPSPPKPAPKAEGKRPRKRRPVVRALRAAAALRACSAGEETAENAGNSSGSPPEKGVQQTPATTRDPPGGAHAAACPAGPTFKEE